MSYLKEFNHLEKLDLSDLHCHLGAAVSVRALWEIAHEQGISLPKKIKNYWDFMKHIKVVKNEPHDTYLDRFKAVHKIQSSPLAVERSMYHAVSHAYTKCNITTLEIRMNPMLRNLDNYYDLDMIIFNACIGVKKAIMMYPVKAGIILGIERKFTPEQAEIIATKAAKYKSHGVVGIDVSGHSPRNFKVGKFTKAFNIAREAGLGLTFHTGEVTGSDEMLEVMKKIKPHRIGHGIKCIDDQKLINLLRDRETVLEICPTSNMRLGVINDIEELHKIMDVVHTNKLNFCINSDGPVFLNISVNDELIMLYENKIFNGEEIKDIVMKSHKYSFIE